MGKHNQIWWLGIGASAGGLAAFTTFFEHMPPDSGMAFVLVQHLDPQQPSLLPELLASHTRMPVHPVVDQMLIAPNQVYLIPPNTTLTIDQGMLCLATPTEARGHRMPIDHFFLSLAANLGTHAVGLILSGTGTDGTLGLVAIKQQGGMTIAQTPDSAQYDAMPRSAIDRGVVDYVLAGGADACGAAGVRPAGDAPRATHAITRAIGGDPGGAARDQRHPPAGDRARFQPLQAGHAAPAHRPPYAGGA